MLRALIMICCIYSLGYQAASLKSHTVIRPDGTDLIYYLDKVRESIDQRKQSLLLILQGSDCNSVANLKTISEYAEIAPEYAVLFVEKYAISNKLAHRDDENREDCPGDYLKYNSIDQRVLDALQVLSKLRDDSSWWDGNLVIVGGSVGAIVGERLAPLAPEARGLIIFGFGARRMQDEMVELIKASLSQSELDVSAQRQELEKIIGLLRTMRDNPTMMKYSSGHSFAYWESLFRFDQYHALDQLLIPVLAVHGSRDSNASSVGARRLMSILKESGNQNIVFREYDDLDHSFLDTKGVSHRKRIIREMSRWILENIPGASSHEF